MVDRLPGAAEVLDVHGLEQRPALDLVGLEQEVDLVDLAAQADHQHAGEVRVAGIAPQGALQVVVAFARIRHAAAGRMGDRHHAVDIRELLQHAGALEMRGDHPAGGGRAVHRRQDADVVAGADLAIGAAEALEGRALGLRQHRGRLGVGAEGVVALEIAHGAVLDMDVLAGADRLGGEADDLVVAADRLARRDRPGRHLVAGRDVAGGGHPLLRDRRARRDVGAGENDVVVAVQADEEAGAGHRFCTRSWACLADLGRPLLYVGLLGRAILLNEMGTTAGRRGCHPPQGRSDARRILSDE